MSKENDCQASFFDDDNDDDCQHHHSAIIVMMVISVVMMMWIIMMPSINIVPGRTYRRTFSWPCGQFLSKGC